MRPGILLGALALALGAGPAWAQATRAGLTSASPVVVDADDRVMGPVEGGLLIGVVTVAIRLEGRVVPLIVLTDRLIAFGRVVFESGDCQGPPLLFPARTPGTALFYGEAAIGPGQILQGVGGPPEARTIASMYVPGDPPACQPVTPLVYVVFPTITLIDLDLFTPPYRVR